ncbi:hypothetical protein [Streptomyces torulosus]|nr:hypothetical protein [Streptomyces torulosus]
MPEHLALLDPAANRFIERCDAVGHRAASDGSLGRPPCSGC